MIPKSYFEQENIRNNENPNILQIINNYNNGLNRIDSDDNEEFLPENIINEENLSHSSSSSSNFNLLIENIHRNNNNSNNNNNKIKFEVINNIQVFPKYFSKGKLYYNYNIIIFKFI